MSNEPDPPPGPTLRFGRMAYQVIRSLPPFTREPGVDYGRPIFPMARPLPLRPADLAEEPEASESSPPPPPDSDPNKI